MWNVVTIQPIVSKIKLILRSRKFEIVDCCRMQITIGLYSITNFDITIRTDYAEHRETYFWHAPCSNSALETTCWWHNFCCAKIVNWSYFATHQQYQWFNLVYMWKPIDQTYFPPVYSYYEKHWQNLVFQCIPNNYSFSTRSKILRSVNSFDVNHFLFSIN